MHKILIFISAIILIVGCGSGGGEEDTTPGLNPGTGDTEMVVNQLYTVSKGDQVIKNSSGTKIKILHSDGSRRSTVELIAGNATLRIN
jgi:uncharacterized lipoprotein YehR (DUF1307 family)